MSRPLKTLCLCLCCLCMALPLTGCYSSTELNQLAIVMGIGVDVGEEPDTYHLTAQIARPSKLKSSGDNPSSTGDSAYADITATNKDINEAMHEMMSQVSRRLYMAHTQVLVLGREIAEKDISPIVDYFIRSLEGRFTIQIIIAEGKAIDLLEENLYLEQIPSMHLKGMLKSQIKNAYVGETTLFTFLDNTLSLGIVPIAPLMALKPDNQGNMIAQVDGTAVFMDGRMVGQLNAQQTRVLLLLLGKAKDGYLEVEAFDSYISLDVLEVNLSITPRLEGDQVIATIKLQQSCAIVGTGAQQDFTSEAVKSHVAELASQKSREGIDDLLNATKAMGADVCGFGMLAYRKYPAQMENRMDDWASEYPNLQVEYELETLIGLSGALLDPIVPRGEMR